MSSKKVTEYMENILKNISKGITLGKGAYITKDCSVIGNVILGEDSSIWYGSVVRGDIEPIFIGDCSNIQDGSILHVSLNKPIIIGSGVSIGHGVKLHGCTIGDNVLVGIGAIILDGAIIEDNCVIAAGSLVPPGKRIPSGSMVMGSPGKVVRTLEEKDLNWIRTNAIHYVEYKNIYTKFNL